MKYLVLVILTDLPEIIHTKTSTFLDRHDLVHIGFDNAIMLNLHYQCFGRWTGNSEFPFFFI